MPFMAATIAGTATAGEVALTAATVAAAGSGISAYSSYQQGQEVRKASEFNAAIADRDAKAAEADAAAEKQQAFYEAKLKRDEKNRVLSRQRSQYAKAGVLMEGAPLMVMGDTAAELEKDALMIEEYGRVGSARTRSKAGRFRAQGSLERYQGRSAARAGTYGAGASLLTGVSNAYFNYKGAG